MAFLRKSWHRSVQRLVILVESKLHCGQEHTLKCSSIYNRHCYLIAPCLPLPVSLFVYYVCVCMWVCLCVCLCICMCLCMCVCTCLVCVCAVCVNVCVNVCVHVCMLIHVCVCVCVCVCVFTSSVCMFSV